MQPPVRAHGAFSCQGVNSAQGLEFVKANCSRVSARGSISAAELQPAQGRGRQCWGARPCGSPEHRALEGLPSCSGTVHRASRPRTAGSRRGAGHGGIPDPAGRGQARALLPAERPSVVPWHGGRLSVGGERAREEAEGLGLGAWRERGHGGQRRSDRRLRNPHRDRRRRQSQASSN